MKLQLAAVLLFLSMRFGNALQVPQAILTLFSKPACRLPPFLCSIENPWLEENRSWLERIPDPVKELCSLDGKLRPGSSFVPADLFRHLSVNSRHRAIDSDNADSAEASIQDILNCTAALQDVESVDVSIRMPYQYVTMLHDPMLDWKKPEVEPIDPELPKLLAHLLGSLPNLSSLKWSANGEWNHQFCAAFESANLTLPAVKRLNPAPEMACLVRMCPKLESIEATHIEFRRDHRSRRVSEPLINATSHAGQLSNFTMAGGWEFENIEAALENMPNLTTLNIGGMNSWSEHECGFDDDDDDPTWCTAATEGWFLQRIAKVLAQFPQLRHLGLPPSYQLELGWAGGPGCGNVYFGAEGRAYGRWEVERGAEVEERATRIVLSLLSDLDSLEFGSFAVNLTRHENGTGTPSWPWTGRMEEYKYEVWPETGKDI